MIVLRFSQLMRGFFLPVDLHDFLYMIMAKGAEILESTQNTELRKTSTQLC